MCMGTLYCRKYKDEFLYILNVCMHTFVLHGIHACVTLLMPVSFLHVQLYLSVVYSISKSDHKSCA